MTKLIFHDKIQTFEIALEAEKANWLMDTLEKISVFNNTKMTFAQLKSDFEEQFEDFELFWYAKPIHTLRDSGLLVL